MTIGKIYSKYQSVKNILQYFGDDPTHLWESNVGFSSKGTYNTSHIVHLNYVPLAMNFPLF